MNKLIMHLGPPKTATSSLQQFFQEQNFTNIEYLGINHPSRIKNYSLTYELYKEAIGEENNFNIKTLEQKKDKNHLILSEELFLVEERKIPWKEKLKKLKIILSDFEVTIVIVAREPISAIKSYYQEIYYSINKEDFPTINHFALSDYCEIYDYKKLIEELNKIGFHDLKILDYDKLISGHYTLNELGIDDDSYIELGHKNKSLKKNNIYYANNPNLKGTILHKIPKSLKDFFPLSYKQKLSKLIPNIKLKKRKIIDVNISNEISNEFNKSYDIIKKSISKLE